MKSKQNKSKRSERQTSNTKKKTQTNPCQTPFFFVKRSKPTNNASEPVYVYVIEQNPFYLRASFTIYNDFRY